MENQLDIILSPFQGATQGMLCKKSQKGFPGPQIHDTLPWRYAARQSVEGIGQILKCYKYFILFEISHHSMEA